MPYLKRQAPCPEPIDCKILTAALDLFVEKGYHTVSIHEIQKQSDVSIGSIYKHFGGKEGVAKALYNHVLNEFDELIDRVLDDISSPLDQLEEIIKQLFEHTETHQHIISFIFHAKHTDFLPNEPLMCDTTPFIKIKEITTNAIKKGEIQDTDTIVANSLIFGGTIRLIQLRLDGIIDQPLIEYKSSLMSGLWNGLK